MADAAEYQARLRHSLLDLARRLQSGGNADTVDFAIFRLQQINRHLVQSDRFNEVVHCISAVTVLLESVEEFGTYHGPHATSVLSSAARRTKFDIPQEQLQYLIDYEISMTKIAQALGVSKSAAMGTKMAVAFANLFMAEIEIKMVNESRIKSKVWKRYIDDVFSLWDVNRKDVDLLIEQANTFHPTIKFTAEISEKEITFLDTLV